MWWTHHSCSTTTFSFIWLIPINSSPKTWGIGKAMDLLSDLASTLSAPTLTLPTADPLKVLTEATTSVYRALVSRINLTSEVRTWVPESLAAHSCQHAAEAAVNLDRWLQSCPLFPPSSSLLSPAGKALPFHTPTSSQIFVLESTSYQPSSVRQSLAP